MKTAIVPGGHFLWSIAVWLLAMECAFVNGQDEEQRIRTGMQAMQAKRYKDAAAAFQSVLDAGVANEQRIADVHFYLGLSLQLQADALPGDSQAQGKELRTKARQSFVEVTQRRPQSAGSWNNLGLVCARLGEQAKAGEAFRTAISLGTSEQPTFLLNYADLLRDTGLIEDAIRFYREVATIQPSNSRVRKELDKYYLERNRAQLLSFVWRLFDDGSVDWAVETAIRGLETSPPAERIAPQLLNCVVRCLARQDYDPREFPQDTRFSALEKDSRISQGVKELRLLHRGDVFDPLKFQWWSKQIDLDGNAQAPRGGWPEEGFVELIRALGERYELRRDVKSAEKYYRLAYELNTQYLDPVAIIKLADLWVKTGNREMLDQFLNQQEIRIFFEKGEAIEKRNYKRIYEIHRALALIYMHVDRWTGGDDTFHNAEYQLRTALEDAARFNAAADSAGRPERIADWQLVDKLASRYESTNRKAKAFTLRVDQAKEFLQAQKSAEASQVFRPLVGKTPPAVFTEEAKKSVQSLNAAFGTDGFRLSRPEIDDEARFQLRTADGQQVQLWLGTRANIPADEKRHIQELIQTLVTDAGATQAKPATSSEMPVRLLPKGHAAKDVEKVQFDGRKGSVELKGQSTRVPFSIDSPTGKSNVDSFRYVKP